VSGRRIIDGLRAAVNGNFSSVMIEGQTWVRLETGCTVVPIEPTDEMLAEMDRIADGPLISSKEFWGYVVGAARASLDPHNQGETEK
jgi:hypothetical protein